MVTGHDLRAAREAKRVSLGKLADRIGRDKGHLSRVERGVDDREVTPALVRDYERALGVTVAATNATASAAPEEHYQQPRPGRSRRMVDGEIYPPQLRGRTGSVGRKQEQEDEDVHRRSFLQGFVTLGLAGPASMAGVEALRHELVASLCDESTDLDDWEAVAWEYGCTYAAAPPRVLFEDLATDLLVAHDQLGRLRDDHERRGMQRVVAHLAAFLAQTVGNLGNARAGHRWWRIARQSADASRNVEAQVWVRGREIIRGLYEHRPPETLLNLADEATAISHTPGMGTGSVLIGRAQILAVLGRAVEAERAMTEVYATVDRLPHRITADTESMFGWPEYRLRHGESLVYTYLGDSRRAEAAQERALSLYPTNLFRERAQVQLYQAMRLIRDGEPTIGARHACRTLDDLPQTHRIEVVLEVARSVARAVPNAERHRPAATELRELLTMPSAAPPT